MSRPSTNRLSAADGDTIRRTIMILFCSGVLLFVLAGVACLLSGAAAFHDMAEMETHTYEPPMFATAAEATKACGIKLPQEARNIQIVSRGEWLECEEYVRFEAPIEVCLSHAASIVGDDALDPIPSDQLVAGRATMSSMYPGLPGNSGGTLTAGIGLKPGWWDLSSATNVVGAGGGTNKPEVWVDQTRGVFYYHQE